MRLAEWCYLTKPVDPRIRESSSSASAATGVEPNAAPLVKKIS